MDGVTVEVVWTGPTSSSLTNGTTPTGSGTSYSSILPLSSVTVSDAGPYTCTARLTSSLPFLLSSDTNSGSTTVTVQSKLHYYNKMSNLSLWLSYFQILHHVCCLRQNNGALDQGSYVFLVRKSEQVLCKLSECDEMIITSCGRSLKGLALDIHELCQGLCDKIYLFTHRYINNRRIDRKMIKCYILYFQNI